MDISIYNFPLTLAFFAAVVEGARRAGVIPASFGPPAQTKPFATFKEFYPFYLREHSNPMCKRLHFVGTLIFLTLLVRVGRALGGEVAPRV